jgi:hypothetical protein
MVVGSWRNLPSSGDCNEARVSAIWLLDVNMSVGSGWRKGDAVGKFDNV